MKLVQQLDHFLLTGRALPLGLLFDRQPLYFQLLRLTLLLLIISATWYGIIRI